MEATGKILFEIWSNAEGNSFAVMLGSSDKSKEIRDGCFCVKKFYEETWRKAIDFLESYAKEHLVESDRP